MTRALVASFAIMAALVIALRASPAHAVERSIDKEIVVPAPINAVWQSWTTNCLLYTSDAADE